MAVPSNINRGPIHASAPIAVADTSLTRWIGWWLIGVSPASNRDRDGLVHLLQTGAGHLEWILFPVRPVEELE